MIKPLVSLPLTQRAFDAVKAKRARSVRVSEVFYSIEGEGPLTGFPTVFVRLFGCNFTCSGFNNPTDAKVIPLKIQTLEEFVPTHGCDSIYSWHPEYKHLTSTFTAESLAKKILSLLPGKAVKNPRSGVVPVLSVTGGEPTLHQRAILELLEHPLMTEFKCLLIETNAAVTLTSDFINGLNAWSSRGNTVVWSNSPKLRISGELEIDAIRPDVIASQMLVLGSAQYFKFVSAGTEESFQEIEATVQKFKDGLPADHAYTISPDVVYVMPVGAGMQEQNEVQTQVAEHCLNYGYNFCARVHVYVFKNAIGT